MKIVSKLREKLLQVFEEPKTNNYKNVRLWPLFLWMLISEAAGFYLGPLIFGEYRMTGFLLVMAFVGFILFKPMVKLSVKKQHQSQNRQA